MPRASVLLCVALAVSGMLVPFEASGAQSSAPAAAVAMHEVTDEMGRTIRIPVNPTRIVSLAPSLTETVYALGAEDRLVGDTDYCDYPPDAQKKTKVGGVIDPNLEQIAALHPDLVLVTKDANRLETVRALETFGIPSYATDPHKVAEIIASTEKLADVLNVPAAGKAVAEDLQRRLAALQAKLNGVPPRRVLFVVWTEPLISVGKGTFVADAVEKAGGVSIVDSSQNWPQISMEEVAHLQPEYLVFASSHIDIAERDFDALTNLPGWRILEAVKARRYAIVSEAVIRPAPRIVAAIEGLSRQLHPEAFRETSSQEKGAGFGNSAMLDSQATPAMGCATGSATALETSCAR